MGFSDDQRPDVNSGYFYINRQLYLSICFIELQSIHHGGGPKQVAKFWSTYVPSNKLAQGGAGETQVEGHQ